MSTLPRSEGADSSESRQKLRRSAKGTTCTHCRQLKLKCDSATVYPQDCSRCRRAGHQCIVDPTFRRRGNREYTQSLEKEVQSLRHLREKSPSSGASPDDHPTGGSSTSGGNVSGDALEDVRLSPTMTISLIEIYFTCYHPYFPILPNQNEFLAEYDSNRLLLWTVLAIASKGRDDIPNVYESLVEPVRRLASDIYAPQSRSLKTMQALILLCVWPFPHQQTINDPSPMYCSLATHIGYQLGLHRPLHKSDFDERATGLSVCGPTEQKTWYGCFIANQGLALRLGLPATIAPGNAITSALETNDPQIPESLRLDLHISYLSYQWTKTLGDDETTSSGQHPNPSHLITTFESQIAQMRERYSSSAWPKFLHIKLAGLQLQVYSFAINRHHAKGVDRGAPALPHATDEILQAKALSAMITVATESRKDAPSLGSWPVFARYHVMFTTCLGVYMAAKSSDEAIRSALIETCKNNVQLLHGWALYPRDSFARITKHITTSIRRIESHGGQGLLSADDGSGRPNVTSRMAANIPYQLVWNAKHGKTPDPVPPPTAQGFSALVQPRIGISQQVPNTTTGTAMPYQNQPEQAPFGYSFGEIDDSMFLEDWTEADFTDIELDWQSMLAVPGMSWA